MAHEPTLSAPQLRSQIERLEQEVRQAQRRVLDAEDRAARAEQSAREAWAFTKALRGTSRHLTRKTSV
jgi:outer membrane murein-binding lipoprotein Lpp